MCIEIDDFGGPICFEKVVHMLQACYHHYGQDNLSCTSCEQLLMFQYIVVHIHNHNHPTFSQLFGFGFMDPQSPSIPIEAASRIIPSFCMPFHTTAIHI